MKRFFFTLLFFTNTLLVFAGTDNIAPLAKVTASSVMNEEKNCNHAVDGWIGVYNKNEWASAGKMNSWGAIDYPWIQLTWDQPHTINKIILYDRPDMKSHTAGGTLHFSDGSSVIVTTIPNDGTAKAVSVSARQVSWVRFEVTDGDGDNLGLSEIEIYPSWREAVDYVAKVDPYIESARGRYFFFVTGSQPFGMISAAPLTRNKNQYGGGYNYNSQEVLGFPQIHCWMLSGLSLMPTTGNINPSLGEQSWKSTFSHDGEIVQPGYHKIYLATHGIWVEQTCSDRVSYYRLRYTRDNVSNLLLNLGGYVSTTTMTDASVSKVNNTELEGSFNTTGRLWGGPDNVRIFFVAKFDKPFEQMDEWNGENIHANSSNLKSDTTCTPRSKDYFTYWDAPTAGVGARYTVKAGDEIQVKFAVSYTSIENARKNMQADGDQWDFDEVHAASRKEWNEYLGRIDVKGGSEAQQVKFYTDLWHTLLGRHKLDDVSGNYPDYTQGERHGNHTNAHLIVRKLPLNEDGKAKHHMYNSDAFWLTQWNLNTLWGLAWPEVQDDFAACLVQYDENGGLLPRGPNAGGYSYIMTGCPATNLITSAFQKNILTKTNTEKAYQAMVRNHKPGGMLGDVKDIQLYIDSGYYPNNAGITLEIAFQDWALAQMAYKLGKKQDGDYYSARACKWTKLYNPQQKLIFPKNTEGKWIHTNPLSGDGWVEANAWQATWSVSHGIAELVKLMGGKDTLCQKLSYAFEQARKEDFVFGYSDGYVSYANQPGCSNAHVFNVAGKPWLSQYWVRKVKEQAYGAVTPDKGYGGHDEDQGQMGGVSALMAIGLFSLQGTSSQNPGYEITSPVFDEITIRLNKKYYQGTEFKIKTHNNSVANCYIQKAKLNEAALNSCTLSHKDFARGGELELWLGKQPNKKWGVK